MKFWLKVSWQLNLLIDDARVMIVQQLLDVYRCKIHSIEEEASSEGHSR